MVYLEFSSVCDFGPWFDISLLTVDAVHLYSTSVVNKAKQFHWNKRVMSTVSSPNNVKWSPIWRVVLVKTFPRKENYRLIYINFWSDVGSKMLMKRQNPSKKWQSFLHFLVSRPWWYHSFRWYQQLRYFDRTNIICWVPTSRDWHFWHVDWSWKFSNTSFKFNYSTRKDSQWSHLYTEIALRKVN